MPIPEDIIDLLVRFIRQEASKSDQQQVRALAEEDPDIAELLKILKDMHQFTAATNPALQQAAAQLARQLFVDFHRAPEEDPDRVPAGVTVFDSSLLPLPPGVRPAQIDTRQLRYRIGALDLVVMLYPIGPDSFELIGQLSGYDQPDLIEVKLMRGSKQQSVESDRHGLFRFERVPVGNYHLLLVADKTPIGSIDLSL